jgi:hypothetical protein
MAGFGCPPRSRAVVDDARLVLVKVIYRPAEQRRLISNFMQNAARLATRYAFSSKEDESMFWGIAASAIAHLVVAIKDPVFKEENEWRLVNTTIIEGEHFSYRVAGRRIVPYVKIPLSRRAITGLVRGPQFGGDRGAEDILRYSVFSDSARNVRDSKIPLRP